MPWLSLAGVALLASILLWQGFRSLRSPSQDRPQRAVEVSTNNVSVKPSPVLVVPGPDTAEPSVSRVSQDSPGRVEVPVRAAVQGSSPSPPDLPPAAIAVEAAPSKPVSGADRPAPTPNPLKLQAIVFHPTQPCAMINGKTLFKGDSIGDLQLVAISREAVTLVGAGRTNVLRLP